MTGISKGKIKTILDREDIESLLAAGAPADEYECEAEMIYDRIMGLRRQQLDKITIEQIYSIVTEVWQEMFGAFDVSSSYTRQTAYRNIATQIWEVDCG